MRFLNHEKGLCIKEPFSRACSDKAFSERASKKAFCFAVTRSGLCHTLSALPVGKVQRAADNVHRVSQQHFIYKNRQGARFGPKAVCSLLTTAQRVQTLLYSQSFEVNSNTCVCFYRTTARSTKRGNGLPPLQIHHSVRTCHGTCMLLNASHS